MEIILPGQYTEQPALVKPVLSKSAGLDDLWMSVPSSTALQGLYVTEQLCVQQSALTAIPTECILTAAQESSGTRRKCQSPSTGCRAERPPYTNRYCSPGETQPRGSRTHNLVCHSSKNFSLHRREAGKRVQ